MGSTTGDLTGAFRMLTDDELTRWNSDGALVISDAVPQSVWSDLPRWADAIAAWTPRAGDEWPLLQRRVDDRVISSEHVATHHRGVNDLACVGPMVDIATVLMGEAAVLHADMIRHGGDQAAGVHESVLPPALRLQNQARYVDRHIACIVAIDSFGPGEFEIARGWHHRDVQTDRYGNIPRVTAATMRWTSVGLMVGETLWLHRRTPYRSVNNWSARTLELTYSARVQGDLRAAHYVIRRRQLAAEALQSPKDPSGVGQPRGRR